MIFKFACPFCGQRISTTTDCAGTIGLCPACGKDVEVPAPDFAPSLPPPLPSRAAAPGPVGPALAALALCGLPWAGYGVLCSLAWDLSPAQVGGVAVLLTVPCVAGLIVAHRARRHAAGQPLAAGLRALGLLTGYLWVLAMLLVALGFATGRVVYMRHVEPPPDFSAESFFDPTPQPTPRRTGER